MAFTDTPKLGVSLTKVDTAADIASNAASVTSHKLGSEVLASDGKRYVYAQAGATISASTTVAAINTSTFVAAATGGAYTSPATAMAAGDRGWFGAASV
jgi:hypothetical protein